MDNMKNQLSNTNRIFYRIASILLLIFVLISCESLTSTDSANTSLTQQIEQNTPPVLPPIYQSAYLNPLDTPRTYLEDTCIALRRKLDPLTAEPGTVVMILALHEIYNSPIEDPDGITAIELANIMQQLKDQGFEAINTKQFLFFMKRNIKIPPRSVLIIQDGNNDRGNFERNFRKNWEDWGWPVVNGWVSEPSTPESMWEENKALENEGWVDHEAHGVFPGTVLSDDTSKAVITRELEGSLTGFADHFGKTPYAIIWPGGGFGLRPVRAARQLGYQLGFTTNARGPVMYNWIPLANEVDPARPSYIPEGPVNDPLMTLPRYSPSQILESIDTVRLIGKEAAAYARANKAAELEYYETVCRPSYGPVPSP